MTNPTDYAIDWWKNRHELVYFPLMIQHKDWCVYDAMEPWFLESLVPNKQDIALEIGCGYGQWMAPLASIVESVIGFDIHQSLVDKFNEHQSKGLIPSNAKMYLSDGKTINEPDESVDLIYSISVFQHMPRATVLNYYKETSRVLKKGGRAGFYFRTDDGIGEYSKDIEVDHTGDWSVGWSKQQVHDVASSVNLSTNILDMGCSLFAIHRKAL